MVLQHMQQLGLQGRMHFADLIQENRAAVRLLKLAEFLPRGAGKSARLIAKQFAFQKLVRDRGAVYLDEGFIGARRLRMNHTCHHFFAGSTLAADQDRGGGVSHLLDGHFDLEHARAGSEQHGEVALLADLLAQLRYLGVQTLCVQNPADSDVEFLGVDRLAEVIVRAQLGSFENRLGIFVVGKDHNGNRRLDVLQALKYGSPSRVHRRVHQYKDRIEAAEDAKSFLIGRGYGNLKVSARQMRGQILGHGGVIVNDQNTALLVHSSLLEAAETRYAGWKSVLRPAKLAL